MAAVEQTQETPQLRWSSVRDCPRKAVYEATDAPHRDRTLNEERILYRGKAIGREFAVFLAARERAKGKLWRIFVASGVIGEWPRRYLTSDRAKAAFIVEEAVPWPLGILHPDIRVVETNTIVEVLSSAHASTAYIRSKMLQLVGQIEYTGAHGGAVVVVDPTNLADEIFPLARTSKLYAELVDEMRARVATVQSWADTGETPSRVCGRPSDARSHFCLYPEHCFTGWEATPLPVVDDPETRELAVRLYETKQRERGAKQELQLIESERKEIEQRLVDLVPAGKYQIGSVEVARSDVKRSPSFDWKKAEAAGRFDADLFADFFKAGAEYSTWRVDRIGDQPLHDFGGDAPWTDADLGGDA